jgi:hypothetical protein
VTLSNPNTATIIYSYFFVIAALLTGISIIAKHTIGKHTDELKDRIDRITYALFNDGRGIEWQIKETNADVKELMANQQKIIVDVEVLKASKPRSRSTKS